MEGCEKKYSNKVTLRQHLVKQHLSNSNGTTDLAQNIDILPILLGDMQDVEQSGSKVTTASPSSTDSIIITPTTTSQPSEVISKQNIDPLEDFIVNAAAVTDTALIQNDNPIEINQAMISQLLTSVETTRTVPMDTSNVQTTMVTSAAPAEQPTPNALIAGQNAVSILPVPVTSINNINKLPPVSTVGPDLDSGVVTRVIQENWSGSARTDYRSNHLSEKGRKRQQLLKDNALSAINLDSSSFQDPSEENFIVPTSAVSFSPPENLSRGITFRDPETGVLYVQTQLLQDDPPNPELYPDEHVLASDLSSLNDSVGSEQSLSDIEFTGSTINLQDLA